MIEPFRRRILSPQTTQAPEIGRSPDIRLLASFPITGRENLELKGYDGRKVTQITKFTCQGNLNDHTYGETEREFTVIVSGIVGPYEDGGMVDIYEAATVNSAGVKNAALTAIVRQPHGAFLKPGILIATEEQSKPPVKNVNYYIEYAAAIRFGGRKIFQASEHGMKYAVLPDNRGFQIPEIKPGDAKKLAENITQRYEKAIMLDVDGLISNICNWAHCQDVPAVDALQAIDEQITAMGSSATEYQKRLQDSVQEALMTLKP